MSSSIPPSREQVRQRLNLIRSMGGASGPPKASHQGDEIRFNQIWIHSLFWNAGNANYKFLIQVVDASEAILCRPCC